MNKAVLFGVAAAAGIGTAFLVFQGGDTATTPASETQPAGVGAPPPSKMVHDPNSKRREGERTPPTAPPPGSAKDTEFVRRTMAAAAAPLNLHANSAAPLWQAAAMDLNSESPDLAARARAMGTELRQETRNPDADLDALVKKERELFEEVRRAGVVKEDVLSKLSSSIDTLESAPRGPLETGNTPAAP